MEHNENFIFEDFDYSVFRSNMQALVDSHGKSITSMAYDLNISPPTLSRYISGARKPDVDCLIKISSYFNVSVDWLLGIGGEKSEVFSADVRSIITAYSSANENEKRIVRAVLQNYIKGTEE